MKNTQKSKPTKKKILTYYLILAACLLVIAAIAVSVVFAVKSSQNITIDQGQEKPDDPQKPDDPVDTSSMYEFIAPIDRVNLSQSQVLFFNKAMKMYYLHEGLDFAADAGTEVFAAVDGKIVSVTTSDLFFGATITVEHADNVTTVYKYVDPSAGLKAGDTVKRGQVLGTVATAVGIEVGEGSHLHFEIYKNGELAEPEEYLDAAIK